MQFISLVSYGFPSGSVCKESACNAGDLGLIPELGRSPGGDPTPAFWPEEFHGLQRHKELDVTEQLSESLSELKQ